MSELNEIGIWWAFIEFALKKDAGVAALLSHGKFRLVCNSCVGEPEQPGIRHSLLIDFPEGSFYARKAKEEISKIEKIVKDFFGEETCLAKP